MTPPSALSGPVPPLGIANFRHVTKCRGGSGGDLPSFLPVRCLMLKLVHPQISKPWECHLYFAQGCHLNFALTEICRIIRFLENPKFGKALGRSICLNTLLILVTLFTHTNARATSSLKLCNDVKCFGN